MVDLNSLLRQIEPVTEVPTSIGTIYLYPLRSSDLQALGSCSESEDSQEVVRRFLPAIASLQSTQKAEGNDQDIRPPLPNGQVQSLSAEEIEELSEQYLSAGALCFISESADDGRKLDRENDETACHYLVRLLKHEREREYDAAKKLLQGTPGSFYRKALESADRLGASADRFQQVRVAPKIQELQTEYSRVQAEQFAQLRIEREGELRAARENADLAAQSAQTLAALAQYAATLLNQMDERDKKADRASRIAIWIAIGSLVTGALLSAGALVYAVKAYHQDAANNTSGDLWQEAVLQTLKGRSEQQRALEETNQRQQQQIEQLQQIVSELKKRDTAKDRSQ